MGLELMHLLHMLLYAWVTCKLLVRSVLGDLGGQEYKVQRGICVAYAL